ncbi:MAG: hypothetical protein CVU91_00980 [Firmicutes bacterium HGW-Firmicutes-16]|nr:MAG: hypothetical protein CVU91_00980 [Firmicutes bacterium HGW-Firmicutes-16]
MVGDMKNNQKLTQLLREKEVLFIDVERITNDIFEAPVDIINALLETRGNALERVNQVNDKISPLIEGDEHLKSILNCSCEISGLTGETKELFEQALRIRAVANRIIKNEDCVRQRIENERDLLLEKIETMNRSSKTVAESYKRSVETALPHGFGNSKNKTM